MSVSSREVNLWMEQGADFKPSMIVKNDDASLFDLTGYTIYAKYSKSYTSPSSTTMPTAVVQASGGVFAINMTGSQTRTIKAGRYVFEVFLTGLGNTYKFCHGILTVNPSCP